MKDQIVCILAQLASELGTGGVVAASVAVSVLTTVFAAIARFAQRLRKPASPSTGPAWFAAALVALVLYLLCLGLDPLLASQQARPPGIAPTVWEEVGWFEWKLFSSRWAWPLLPLSKHPALALVLHAAFWLPVIALVRWLLVRWPTKGQGSVVGVRGIDVRYDTPEAALPWYHRAIGATTARRADRRFVLWSRALLVVLVPLHVAAGGLVAAGAMDASGARHALRCSDLSVQVSGGLELGQGPLAGDVPSTDESMPTDVLGALPPSLPAPAPGAWVLAALVLLFWTLHLILEGRPPEVAKAKDEEEALDADTPLPDPLARLAEAVRALHPGAELIALEELPEDPGERAPLPEAMGPMVRELCIALAGDETLYAHQVEVLEHLSSAWALRGAADRGPTPSLAEEVLRSPVRKTDESAHALVLAPEGAGRTTTAYLAALHVHFDRGATTLVVLRDRDAARAWAERLQETLVASSARWSVQVCVAGDDLSAALLQGKVPSVVVADLEALEGEVLADPRTDGFLDRLGLVIADDVDAMTGVAEMHMHASMRRLWALSDTRRASSEASYPLVLLAIAGPAPLESWARHVLAAPLRLFERDTAPTARRVLLRRRDLVDGSGRDLPLAVLAAACDGAGMPWHMRLAGDGMRSVRRAEIDLGRMRRHHRADPREAEVVLLEGTFPDVRREADRLAHAGVLAEGATVVVLAPPPGEELVLHEEAEGAPMAALIDALPRAITLGEPDVVKQRHFDRALGREHDVEALRRRFGAGTVDEALDRMRRAGRIRERKQWFFDRRKDDAAARTLVRAQREAALGEPIHADCVSDSSARVSVVDEGTSEVLLQVDRAVAAARFPSGRIFLHPRGRYVVTRPCPPGGTLCFADHAGAPDRTTLDRVVLLPTLAELTWSERELGGRPVHQALVRTEVEERVLGVRRYAPDGRAHRERYDAPEVARYATDVCLLSLHGEPALSEAARPPLAAALRMMLPCALRGANELVDVALVDFKDKPTLAFFDRTPGSSGFAAYIARDGLGDLLRLARLALERLVGSELLRLRRLHDTSVLGDTYSWAPYSSTPGVEPVDLASVLTFLDGILDAPPSPEERSTGRRVEYVAGEGQAGDLGRLWISEGGRTDDLVWTRHAWTSSRSLGGAPAGPVHFDLAVERRAIANAVAIAAHHGAPATALDTRQPAAWRAAHAPSHQASDLSVFRSHLASIAGEASDHAVLELVAAIQTWPRALSPAERTPLSVLMRRRADPDAKVLLAFALLSEAAAPAVLVGEAGVAVRLTLDGTTHVYDLSGATPRALDPAGLDAALE